MFETDVGETKPFPTCDICHTPDSGIYDTPTTLGPWGNLCEGCFDLYGIKTSVTTKRVKKTTKKPPQRGAVW